MICFSYRMLEKNVLDDDDDDGDDELFLWND